MKNLVIVESPTKARTIGKFLGADYVIKPSMGHVMDLPKSKLGVDLDHDFSPQYELMDTKKELVKELQKAAKDADMILLATDPDREGEAIASNIKDILSSNSKFKIQNSKFRRVVFHEITEEAIKEALENPRDVDTNLVDAQTARRVLDRLVGYQLSPLLWKKVRRGLSAGRVQSVALRLIVEREREIEKFARQIYYTIVSHLLKTGDKAAVPFDLIEINGKKIEVQQAFDLYDGTYKITKTIIMDAKTSQEIVEDLRQSTFTVSDVLNKQTKRSPQAPYTTSTLQQDASRRFGLSGKRTMTLAQKLYEEGYITYHRTDSVVMSQSAITSIRAFVKKEYGEKYIPAKDRFYAAKQKLAQEAHEAIRPTKVMTDAKQIEGILGRDFAKLYELIWRRAVASQMADALVDSTTVYVDATPVIANAVKQSSHDDKIAMSPGVHRGPRNDTTRSSYLLKTNGSVLVFDGFLKVNSQALQDTKLPKYTQGERLVEKEILAEKHETPPPPRYNDASIIATLEEKGIGRPSTYATIIGTLVDRTYVDRVEKKYVPTSIGIAVNDFLVTNFSSIDDIPFTAQMEDSLDNVASGGTNWVSMMHEFYTPFEKRLNEVGDVARVKIAVEDTGELCPECKEGSLVIRTGKFGKFLSCSRFPDCKLTKPYVLETGIMCPKDGETKGGKIILKKTKRGKNFYGCFNYPNCDFAAWKLEDIKKTQIPVTEQEEQVQKSQ